MEYLLSQLSSKYRFSVDVVKMLAKRFSYERVEAMLSNLRTPGKHYSVRVNTLKTSVEEVSEVFRRLGFTVKRHGVIREALLIGVKGPFKVRRAEKIVVADKQAAESVYMGANLYSPGVVEAEGVKKGDEVNVVDKYGERVGYGVALMDGEEMLEKKRGVAVEVKESVYSLPRLRELDEYREGLFYSQSIPAMLVAYVLDPKPGEVIVDMCAAPGGKTTHIAQLTKNRCQVIAFDHSEKRVEELKENIKRLGVENVEVIRADSRYIDLDYPDLKADKVLVDPPCSALGVRPQLYNETTWDRVRALARYQLQFLWVACKIVKPGGYVVYSTCTFTEEENEMVIREVLRRRWKFKVRLYGQKPVLGLPGFTDIVKDAYLCQRFYPDQDMPGFFIAKLKREN